MPKYNIIGKRVEISTGFHGMDRYQAEAFTFCNKYGVRMFATPIDKRPDKMLWEGGKPWKIVISRNGKSMTVFFSNSIFAGDTAPTAYDILACIQKCPTDEYVDFIGDFGQHIHNYQDYLEVGQVLKNMDREYKGVLRLFSDVIDELQEIA